MTISKISIIEPLCYFKSGQFLGSEGWMHKRMCLDGDYEIILGLEKEIHLCIGGISYTISPGDVFVIPPYITFEGNRPSGEGVSFYWMHFFPRLGRFNISSENAVTELRSLESASSVRKDVFYTQKKNADLSRDASSYVYLPLCLHSPSPEKLYILAHQILDIANSQSYSIYCADYLITSLALEITEQYRESSITLEFPPSERSHRLSQILEWIRINVYADLTVASVAEKFAFSPDYLTRLFKKELGIGTNRYINIQKINTVKGLLSTSSMTVKEIAYLLNFKDEKYLMRLFKNIEGITISQYRNAYTNTYLNTPQVDIDIPAPSSHP